MFGFPYPEECSAGASLEGRTDRRAVRRDKAGSAAKSPRISASFFFSSPAFDLPLGGHSIFDALEMLLEDEGYRPSQGGVAVECAGLVLGDTPFQAAVRRAHLVGTVGATQNVETSAHGASPAMARSISASKFAAIA
jgi:hypothetical protein